MDKLTASVAGVTSITEVRLVENYSSPASRCSITCVSTTKSVGDSISVTAGYESANGLVFTGYVKEVRKSIPPKTVTLECTDVLSRAMDDFLASDNPDLPLSYSNIAAETLVQNLLAHALLTSYSSESPGFTFGILKPVEFKLMTVWDAVDEISRILAWHTWANHSGVVNFKQRPQYPKVGESSSFSFSTDILTAEYSQSTDNLRNRVVVYGDTNVFATASAVSPYLPSGFYQTGMMDSEWIQSNSEAQNTANLNLTRLNRLTESARISVPGNYLHHARLVVTATETFTGISGNWLIYALNSLWTQNGYVSELTLSR